MPLDTTTLKKSIKELSADMRTRTENADEEFADRLATIIETYLKSGDIVVSGITTAGTATTQAQTLPVNTKIT